MNTASRVDVADVSSKHHLRVHFCQTNTKQQSVYA